MSSQDTPTTPAPTFTANELRALIHTCEVAASDADYDDRITQAVNLRRVAEALQFAASLVRREERLREALTAIEQSTREDERGEQWTIRAYLDKHGIYHGNIGTSRRLVVEACKVGRRGAMKPHVTSAEKDLIIAEQSATLARLEQEITMLRAELDVSR